MPNQKPTHTAAEAPSEGRPQAVLYLRSASGNQADREMAIVAQQHQCRRRADELGAEVIGEYIDFGSGLGAERPAVTALVARLHELRRQGNRRPTCVIAADHARIACSVEAYSRVSWEIDQAGAVIIIASISLAEYDALARRRSEISSAWRPRPPGPKPHRHGREQAPLDNEE